MQARFIYADAGWEVDGDRRELRTRGQPVPIGARAFEIIEKLAESAGEFVSKDELVAHVWRGATVDENTLRVHIHAIRKALGADRALLKTAAGRGYRLLGPWTSKEDDGAAKVVGAPVAIQRRSNLPASSANLVGRDTSLRHLKDLVSAFRVVTVTGPGGIGKTTVALELARHLLDEFDESVFLVELSALSDPDLVPATVARALGLAADGKRLTPGEVARAIGAAKLLIVLDTCEHLVEATARLAEVIVWQCPRAAILATSREVMKIEGERVYRLPPLEVPDSNGANPEHLFEKSAVELFVQRTQSLDDRFVLNAGNSAAVATICRDLDGIPLAIEFAAGRAATLGVTQVLADLRDRFSLLTSRRRTAIPRHKTLRAVLDWSYDLLSEPEQKFFRSLAVFAGLFSLEDAGAIAAPLPVADWLAGLVEKSLVVSEMRDSTTLYRLLDTTRSYAADKLQEYAEFDTVSRSHAEYYRDLFEHAGTDWYSQTQEELQGKYAWRLDNLRGALAWAFAAEGSAPIGVALATAAIPLWMHLSLLDECRSTLAQTIATGAAEGMTVRQQMLLHAGYGISAMYSGGDPIEAEGACERALKMAEEIGDVDQQLRCLWGLWLVRRGSLDLARRFLSLATRPVDRLVGHRMMSTSHHVQGHQTDARVHVDAIRNNPGILAADAKRLRFLVSERPVSEETSLGRVLWTQGCPDQAMQLIRPSIEAALGAGHANSVCHFLSLCACLVTLWTGRLDEANRYIALLRDQSTRSALRLWQSWCRGYQGMAAVQAGDFANGAELLRVAVEEIADLNEWRGHVFFPMNRAVALGQLGRIEEALELVNVLLEPLDITELWMGPELQRVKGDLLVLQSMSGAEAAAERCFRNAMEEAHRQGALAWELRAAMSLARLYRKQSRAPDARHVLSAVYDRFSEGFETADLTSARAVLESLA